MKRLALLGILLLAFGCSTVSAGIYDLAFDPIVWSTNSQTLNGEPVGSYPMFFNDSTSSDIQLWCITYQVSKDWNFFPVTPTTTGYGAQAYVLSMLGQYDAQIIQWALWILDTSHTINGLTASAFLAPYNTIANPWVNNAILLAAAAQKTPLTSGYVVYVDDSKNPATGIQEYQSMIQLVPEPSLILLLGIGFGSVSLVAWRRK